MHAAQKERTAVGAAVPRASKEAYSNLQPVYQTACLVSSPFRAFLTKFVPVPRFFSPSRRSTV